MNPEYLRINFKYQIIYTKVKNKRILLSTKIDYRKNNWIAGITKETNKNVYIGILLTKKPDIYTEAMIKTIHYTILDDNITLNKSGSLHMIKCSGCDIGKKEGTSCVISLEKKHCVLIKGKVIDRVDENDKKIKVIEQMIEDIIINIKTTVKENKIQ